VTPRSNIVTTVAVAITAYAMADLVHEVVGHGIAALMTPGIRLVSLSTVALQSTGSSRVVAACGSIANVLVGAAALGLFQQLPRFSPAAHFLWLFSSVNLLNGSGYPLFSAVLDSSDWSVVIQGLQPTSVWRGGMAVAGAAAYWGAIRLSAGTLTRAVNRRLLSRSDITRLIFPSYVAGGILLLVASVFNPIAPSLILSSGLSSGFAATAGLTLVPAMVEHRTRDDEVEMSFVPASTGWIVTGVIVGGSFVAVLGPAFTSRPRCHGALMRSARTSSSGSLDFHRETKSEAIGSRSVGTADLRSGTCRCRLIFDGSMVAARLGSNGYS
jgi:hypothetical protein